MQNIEVVPQYQIESKILFIRNRKVMLDRDLAVLYGVETKVLNQAVKRNAKRFPSDSMFQLTKEEISQSLRSQFVVLKRGLKPKTFAVSTNLTYVAPLAPLAPAWIETLNEQ